MDGLTLYRKRLIPDECILLKDDVILFQNDSYLITKWNTIKTRKDLSHGYSGYFFHEGFKVSMMFRGDNTFLYWYCDIVDYTFDCTTNSLTTTDLLIDVIISPEGDVKVVDLDELAIALREHILTPEQAAHTLEQTDHLLRLIRSGEFKTFQDNMLKECPINNRRPIV